MRPHASGRLDSAAAPNSAPAGTRHSQGATLALQQRHGAANARWRMVAPFDASNLQLVERIVSDLLTLAPSLQFRIVMHDEQQTEVARCMAGQWERSGR